MEMVIGLDVHSKQSVYAAQEEETGKLCGRGDVPTSWEGLGEMIDKLGAPVGTRVALETGTQAMWLARMLSTMGMVPVVLNAQEVRKKALRPRQKSDRRDAFELCDGLRRGIYQTTIYVPDGATLRLRAILSRRRHFVTAATRETNAARFVLRAVGLSSEAASLTTKAAWEKLMSRPAVVNQREHISMHATLWAVAREQASRLEAELAEALVPFAAPARRLLTTPGVGPITAATFIATLGTPTRFPDSHAVVSYLGLAPSTYDSGETVRHGRITKQGSSEMRFLLCEAAQQAGRVHHPLHPYWTKLCSKKGRHKAVVAVAARLARILWRLWRDDAEFDVRELNVVADRKVRTKTTYYRLRTPDEARQPAQE